MTRTALFAALALAACNEPRAAPPTGDAPSGGGEDDTALSPPPAAWGSMDHDARRAWMIDEVLPRMSALFVAHDAERYAGFGCASCHGPDAQAHAFRMPSPALPALYDTGTPEQQAMAREYPEDVRFMFSRVLPAMQTLLGAPAYDAETHEGFSCYSCHPRAGDEGTTPIRLSGG